MFFEELFSQEQRDLLKSDVVNKQNLLLRLSFRILLNTNGIQNDEFAHTVLLMLKKINHYFASNESFLEVFQNDVRNGENFCFFDRKIIQFGFFKDCFDLLLNIAERLTGNETILKGIFYFCTELKI